MKILPATVISGLPGTGKTALLRRLQAERAAEKVAVLTSDLGPGEVDAGLCESNTADGSIRCRSREHLGMELRKIGRSREWDRVLIESTGPSDPLPVAELIVLDDGRGTAISRYVKIDTMITLVDAPTFLADITSRDRLTDRGLAWSEKDARCVAELLAAQVELSDVLIVGRAGALDEARLAHLTAMLQVMSPRARVLVASPAEVPVAELLDTGRFDLDAARKAIGIERPEDAPGAPAEGAFSCVAYRRFRPFHPRRFEELVHGELPGVVRSRGVYWLASSPDSAGDWSQVGPIVHHAISGSFWAATPEAEWPVSDERKARIKALWQEPFGDRRQDMVFVVESAQRGALERRLDACLLTDAELALGPAGWSAWAGPDHSANSDHDHADPDHDPHVHVPFRGHTPAGGHHSN